MKKNVLFIIYSCVVVLVIFFFENDIWIGQGCESSQMGNICDKLPQGSSRGYFISLESCRKNMEGQYQSFVCASGPDKNLPEATMYSSFRKVFYSNEKSILEKEVPFSYSLQPISC